MARCSVSGRSQIFRNIGLSAGPRQLNQHWIGGKSWVVSYQAIKTIWIKHTQKQQNQPTELLGSSTNLGPHYLLPYFPSLFSSKCWLKIPSWWLVGGKFSHRSGRKWCKHIILHSSSPSAFNHHHLDRHNYDSSHPVLYYFFTRLKEKRKDLP